MIYFNARGRAEHIRFIFAYAGVEFDDERIPREKWPELKKSKYDVNYTKIKRRVLCLWKVSLVMRILN